MGGMNKDPDQKLQERTQTGQYLPTPQQREQCLAELKGGSSGSDRADPFQTQTPECGDSVRRPVRKDLDEKGLKKAGVARACVAPSLEHPEGLPSGRHLHMGKHRTVMQQHVDFWDTNQDGVISMWDTYIGFRRLGFSIPFSLWAVLVINPAFSLTSSPHWYPDPLFRVYTNNIHKGKHGSDQEVYDHEGRFIPQRFEDLWSKWDREGKGALSTRDIWEMTQCTREAMDFFGWFAGKFEWYTSWLLAADDQGLLRKEAVRAIYDGSLFYKMEDKFWHGKALPQEYKGMGEGGSLSAIWKRWREGRRASKGGLMEQHKSDSLDENLARREAIKTVKYH